MLALRVNPTGLAKTVTTATRPTLGSTALTHVLASTVSQIHQGFVATAAEQVLHVNPTGMARTATTATEVTSVPPAPTRAPVSMAHQTHRG